jgi:hypothetical protein
LQDGVLEEALLDMTQVKISPMDDTSMLSFLKVENLASSNSPVKQFSSPEDHKWQVVDHDKRTSDYKDHLK